MEKENIIENLQKAKLSNLQWIDRANSLISGTKKDTGTVPIEEKESEFGQWLYGEGELLKKLSNNPLECMKSIEVLHQHIHKNYFKIYHIYFSDEKKAGFFSKLMGAKRQEVNTNEEKEAKLLLESLEQYANDLMKELERLERRIEAVGQEKLNFVMKI